MKKLLLLLALSFSITANAQEDKTAFSNFIKRMYTAKSFEGVKIVDDYDHQYLISVISLEKAKYTSESVMNRVAQVKAQSQANTFLNGAIITMETIIKTTEKDSKFSSNAISESIESIKQNSSGFSLGLELLTNFEISGFNNIIFIYCREIKK